MAAGLTRLGLEREQRVAIFLDKRIETVAAIFATSAAGGAFVPDQSPSATTPSCLHPGRLQRARASHVVGTAGPAPRSFECLPFLGAHRAGGRRGGRCRSRRGRGVLRSTSGRSYSSPTRRSPPRSSAIDLDIAAILYTSGSTGKPKGVVLSHRNLIVGAESVSQYLENTAEDVILAALPLSFDAGLSQLTTAFSVGAHVVLMNYLLPGDVVRLCARHGVTGLTCVPPLWIQIADQAWPAEAASTMRYFANTGGKMPKPTLDRLRSTLSAGQAVPHVRADRGISFHLPGPNRSRPPPRLHRQSDSKR